MSDSEWNQPTGSPLEVWCFGCIGQPGHYLLRPNRQLCFKQDVQPWGWNLDGGLCEGRPYQRSDGATWEHHKAGWSAVAFWDQSGDDRGGSCTVFLVNAEATRDEILAAARTQWPEVWNRPRFPLANMPDQR